MEWRATRSAIKEIERTLAGCPREPVANCQNHCGRVQVPGTCCTIFLAVPPERGAVDLLGGCDDPVHPLVVLCDRHLSCQAAVVGDANAQGRRGGQQAIVKATAKTEPSTTPVKGDPRREHQVQFGG